MSGKIITVAVFFVSGRNVDYRGQACCVDVGVQPDAVAAAAFGFYNNHPVGAVRSIQCGGTEVLDDFDTLDVIHVETKHAALRGGPNKAAVLPERSVGLRIGRCENGAVHNPHGL